MVCARCIMVVEQTLEAMNIEAEHIQLGELTFKKSLSQKEKEALKTALHDLGFEWIDDKNSKTIEQIKKLIIDLVHHKNNELNTKLSVYLSQKLHQDYHSLSQLFSEVEGITIEKYMIAQKIEKVKELLVYDELSLSEIADLLHYSSVAYLSNQFKKVTGLSPSHFKKIKNFKRKPLDKVDK